MKGVATVALNTVLVLFIAGLSLGQMVFGRETLAATASKPSPSATHPGIYAFYDWDNLSPAQYPWLTGGVLIRRWNQIAVGPDSLDWSELEAWIAREADLGKRTILRVSPHDGWYQGKNFDGTPAWVYAEGVPQVHLTDGAVYPQYWHPTYRARLGALIAAFGAKYDGDPRVEAVELGIGLYGEAFPGPEDPGWSQAGLTQELWESYVKEVIDAYAKAFVKTPLILMEQMYPRGDFWQMGRMTDYAAEKGIHIGYNGLRAEGQSAWSNWPPTGQPGWHSSFRKWVINGQRMGRFEAHHGFGRPDLVYWAILNALDSGATYLSFYPEDVADSRNQDSFQFAHKYLGKTITSTPGLWVALRDETPTLWQPKTDNYGLGLRQYDPDNTSVGLWNVGGREGLFARGTDQSSGKNYLSFDADDRYLYRNSSAAIEVTVTYLDKGSDSWELQYDAADNPVKVAGIVAKGNTGAWKKKVFTLYDAYFGNRQGGGNDLRLYSRGDGDDIFHMIEVTKQPMPSPTGSVPKVVEIYIGVSYP
jgi:hypothetical protein